MTKPMFHAALIAAVAAAVATGTAGAARRSLQAAEFSSSRRSS